MVTEKKILELNHHFSEATKKEIDNLLEPIIFPAEGNKGFDILNIEKTTKDKLVAVAVECRFSEPGSTKQLSLEEVVKKQEATQRVLQSDMLNMFFNRQQSEVGA